MTFQPPSADRSPLQYAPAATPIPLARHRSAATLMFLLGGLLTVFGLYNVINCLLMSEDTLRASIAANPEMLGPNMPWKLTIDDIRGISATIAIFILATGFTLLMLGSAVRGGNRSAAIGSIVLTCVLLIVVSLFTLFAAIGGFVAPSMFVCACGLLIPIGMMALMLFHLFGAVRDDGSLPRFKTQHSMQYVQTQLATERFGPGGYGFRPPAHLAEGNKPDETSAQG